MLLLSLISCRDEETIAPSKTDLLTSGEWTGTSIYHNGEDITHVIMSTEDFDIRNVKIKFYKGGTYEDNNNGIISNGKWEFADNEQIIIIDKGTQDEWQLPITKLTGQELYLIDWFYNGENEKIEGEMRFKR